MKPICIDANVFIASTKGHETYSSDCRQVIQAVADGKFYLMSLRSATTSLWALAGTWLESISRHIMHMSIIGGKYGKIDIYRPDTFVQGISVTADDGEFMLGD